MVNMSLLYMSAMVDDNNKLGCEMLKMEIGVEVERRPEVLGRADRFVDQTVTIARVRSILFQRRQAVRDKRSKVAC